MEAYVFNSANLHFKKNETVDVVNIDHVQKYKCKTQYPDLSIMSRRSCCLIISHLNMTEAVYNGSWGGFESKSENSCRILE